MQKGLKILKWTAIGIVAITVFGFVTMFLWNWLVPSVFNGNPITFWQALGLFVLSKILFSGLGGKGRAYSHAHWKQKYYQKLSSMTPEERERFKARMEEKWCGRGRSAPGSNKATSVD